MKQCDWERRRQGVFNGWQMQALARESTIEEQLGTYTYVVTVRGTPYVAHVLVNSFDFYERRLHLRRTQQPIITLLICDKYDTCVPIRIETLQLRDRQEIYEPYELPAAYAPERQRTAIEARVLLGQLISGTVNQEEALAPFAPSTRAAYRAKMHQYFKPKPGRIPSL